MLHDLPSVDVPGDCHPLSSLLFGGLICHIALFAVQVVTRKLHTCSVFWGLYVLPVAMASFRGFPMASSDQNSLRTPLPGYCLVTLTDAQPPLDWCTVKGAGPRVRRSWVRSQLCHRMWPAQLPPWAAAVSSVAKQEDWTRAQADLKSLPISQLLELDHPAPPQSSPVLPQLGLCSLSEGWL